VKRIAQGAVAFIAVFLIQAMVRSYLNWPPNSWPELALSRPFTFFFGWLPYPGWMPFLAQGLVGWGLAGAVLSLTLSSLVAFRSLSDWARVILLAACAGVILGTSAALFPAPGRVTI
jgi:hypothetical protein